MGRRKTFISSYLPAISSPINKGISILLPSWCNCSSLLLGPDRFYMVIYPVISELFEATFADTTRKLRQTATMLLSRATYSILCRARTALAVILRFCACKNYVQRENIVRKLVKWRQRFSKIMTIKYRRRLYSRGNRD